MDVTASMSSKQKCALPQPLYVDLLAHFADRFGADYDVSDKLTAAFLVGLELIERNAPRLSHTPRVRDAFQGTRWEEFVLDVPVTVASRLERLENKTSVKTKRRNAAECFYEYMTANSLQLYLDKVE